MDKNSKRALMIARDQRALLRRIANIYPGPAGGMDPSPGGGGYSGPGGGKYIGPSHYADGGGVDDYGGGHRPPGPDGGAPLHDLTANGTVYPDDVYGPQGARFYGTGDASMDRQTLKIAHEARGKPEAQIPVFRAVPKTAGDTINHGDWVTTNPAYARAHGESALRGKYKIIGKTVRADEVFTNGDSLHEYGYWSRHKRADGGSVPPFKLQSGAAKIIKAKGQAKATPQQYAAMPGIKPDELKHSKFDTLGSKALPREEVIKHLEDNAIPLQETTYTGDDEQSALRRYGEEKTALPGGQNYREVLLHAPSKDHPEVAVARGRHKQAIAAFDASLLDQLGDNPQASRADHDRREREAMQAGEELKRLKALHGVQDYKSGHWNQPNVVAHVRMSDRRGPNGEKVLHVEEVQSDWGQAGREHGFGAPEIRHAGDRWTAHDPAGNVIAQGRLEDFRDDQHIMENVAPGRTIPSGPYVDNTQKWTDLALKRVLHEAAHGGYDKIVVTPGDEQNKRYDLSSQVKNISYFPDIGYLHAETHDGKGIEHEDVKPEDLSKHIGKEAADRILKQGLQRHEGRGRLGGEFYHELEGDDLKMGGAGMRGYYDNILPKRLQALAQQHDPQAKVNLHAHPLKDFYVKQSPGYQGNDFEAFTPDDASLGAHPTREAAEAAIAQRRATPGDETAPLHSLDVTPQMRDSIKQGGFNSFKRGGDVTVAKKPSTPAIKKSLDLRSTETFPELATRYPKTAPPEWAYDPKKKTDYLAKRLSPEALAVQTAKKVIQKDIEEGRYKPYFDPLKRYDASSPEFGVKTPTTGIKKVKPETQAKYEARARSPEATTRLSAAFERGMLQPREASDWYLMGQLHNEYVAKHGPKLGSQLFKERFADAMSATTGGADPTSNFLTSHYGNYVKAHKQQFPEKSYDLPFPIGGQYIRGNIDQFDKMIMQGKGVTPANPKRYNFSHNFLGDDSGSTIDEQMSGLYDPKMSVPPEGTYGHYEGALADLAKQTKGAKSPRHFQEVAWAGAKDMGTKGGYRASPMISHINQSIERTSRLTGLSPDEVVAQNLVDVKGPMFKKGGRAGYALSGRVEQLGRDLHQSFGDLDRQVAAAPQQQAPAGGDYKAMLERATQPSLSPDYQAMVNKALAPSGKTYGEMFPANVKPYTPAASALTPIATSQPSYGDAAATDYSSWMTQIMGDGGSGAGTGDGAAGGGSSGGAAGADGAGGDGGASSAGGGSAYRYGGQTSRRLNIVERALAVTRRK